MANPGDSLRVQGFANAQRVADAIDALVTVTTGLTATGANLATALLLPSKTNIITTAPVGTGVKTPVTIPVGETVRIVNKGAFQIAIYANTGQTIDGAAFTVAPAYGTVGSAIDITGVSTTAWVTSMVGNTI